MPTFRNFLATLLILLIFAFLFYSVHVKVENRDLLNIIDGALLGIAGTISAFYFVSNYKAPNQTTTTVTKDIPKVDSEITK